MHLGRARAVVFAWAALATGACANTERHDPAVLAVERNAEVPARLGAPVATSAPSDDPPTAERTLTGTVRVGAGEGVPLGFEGVHLDEPDGTKWIVAYEQDPLWRAFDGQIVAAKGAPYEPVSHAVPAKHFRVESWQLADPKTASVYVSVGPIVELSGTIAVTKRPAGSKLEGEDAVTFHATDGRTFVVVNLPPSVTGDAVVTVRAREIEWSPYAAHVGGDPLWIVEAH